MAILDTAETLAKLAALGHNYNPEKQVFKGTLHAHQCAVYDPQGTVCLVNAADVEQYIAKGMTVEMPEMPEIAEAEAPGELEGGVFVDVDLDGEEPEATETPEATPAAAPPKPPRTRKPATGTAD